MNASEDFQDEMTLDPPGRIAIVGGGPLGVEAALYGRYLGYEVVLFERGEIGQAWLAHRDAPLPMLPGRCLSPLAVAALKAHDGGLALPGDPAFPLTIDQWVGSGLVRLASTDLLVDRIHTHCEVIGLELIADGAPENEDAQAEDEDSYIDGEVPPDYRLTIRSAEETQHVDAEAVIIAIGPSSPEAIAGYEILRGGPYLFRTGDRCEGSHEERLLQGWREIVSIYARLGGRKTLDLYRPMRS